METNQDGEPALASVAQLAGMLSCTVKGCGFDSWSKHMPRLQLGPRAGARTRGNQSMFLSLFLPALPLSLKSISMSSDEEKKNDKRDCEPHDCQEITISYLYFF